jgi:hypothetical protein
MMALGLRSEMGTSTKWLDDATYQVTRAMQFELAEDKLRPTPGVGLQLVLTVSASRQSWAS